jgi:hypothetical protein
MNRRPPVRRPSPSSEKGIPMITLFTLVLDFVVSRLVANHNPTALRG